MTLTEMKTAIEENRITDELINALIYFTWDFDPYGFLDEWGHPDDDGVKETVGEEMRYQVEHCRKEIIETIEYAINEGGVTFRANY